MLYAWAYFLAHEYDLALMVFTTGIAAELHWLALHKLLDGSQDYVENDLPRPQDWELWRNVVNNNPAGVVFCVFHEAMEDPRAAA